MCTKFSSASLRTRRNSPSPPSGGLRCTDTMRHAWGAAVDINPDANCAADRVDGAVKITVGQGWWPLGTEKSEWAGTLAEPSPYSIAAGGSVVQGLRRLRLGLGRNVAVEPRFHAFQRPHRRRLSRILRIREIRRNPQKNFEFFSISLLTLRGDFVILSERLCEEAGRIMR